MKNVLVLSGGGIRGLITLEILKKLPKTKYDLIVGTSTGAIIGAGLASGMEPEQLTEWYTALCSKVFKKNKFNPLGLFKPKYNNENLIQALLEAFEHTGSELGCKFMCPYYDISKGDVVIYKSWKDDFKYRPIFGAVAASTAAPTYFRDFDGGVDGGVYANDPSLIAAIEAIKLWPNEEVNITHIGTGYIKKTYNSANWGALKWIINGSNRPIVDTFIDANTNLTQYFCNGFLPNRFNYKSYDIDLNNKFRKNKIPMDNISQDYLIKLIEVGKIYEI